MCSIDFWEEVHMLKKTDLKDLQTDVLVSDKTARARSREAELIQSARLLAPMLQARAGEADGLRRIPDATIAEFREAGFFRMLQPAHYGGYEVDPRVFFEVQMTLAAGCPSSAW